MNGYSREAVRVKVKKCEMNCSPEWRKFSVDPQLTTVEVLHSILAKAFDIRSEFAIFYRTLDPLGQETFLAVLSDWDLDAAFLRTHNYSVQTGSEPCLNLRVDVKSTSNINNTERYTPEQYKLEHSSIQQSIGVGQKYVQNMQNKLPGLIMNHMEKTFSMVQRALNFAEEQIPIYPPRAPLSDSEFRSFLDSVGQIIRPQELRKVIFLGGIDPSLRRVVWKHILNVYPTAMTGRERMDYMKSKAIEYRKLRDVWKSAVQAGSSDSELAYVTSMVKKDVLRTDRLHPFYAGNDDNQNIASLFNILTTYALNHPNVSYCQGMSDMASPLLVTMNDEAHAYICFCSVMERLQSNFMLDGIAMTQKFSHLTEALQYYDSEFYEYLKLQQADDLLFCYRWLLLELKREFPFDDSLRMLEVQWSSLRSDPPDKELKLFDKEYLPQTENENCVIKTSQKTVANGELLQRKPKIRENHYANICALRRQTSSLSLYSNFSLNQSSLDHLSDNINSTKLRRLKRLNHSLDENISRQQLRRTNLMKAHQSLDETKMLRLLKNVTPCEKLSESFDNSSERVYVEQSLENNFHNESDNVITETKKLIFHSTNPFLNDAQGGSTEILVCDERVEQKNLENIQSNIEHVLTNKVENIQASIQNLTNDSFKRNSCTLPESIISAQIINKHKGHFKELKEKIAASKKGILASIDKFETQLDLKGSPINQNNNDDENSNRNTSIKGQKVIKNLNEFLNFTNKAQISEKSENNIKIFQDKSIQQNYENSNCIMITNDNADFLDSIQRPISKLKQKHINESIFTENDIPQTATIEDLKNDINLELKENSNANETLHEIIENKEDKFKYQLFNESIESKNKKMIVNSNNQTDKYFDNDTTKEHNSNTKVGTYIVFRNLDKQTSEDEQNKRISSSSSNNADVFIWENPLHQLSRNSTCSLQDIDINDNKNSCKSTEDIILNMSNTCVENLDQKTTPTNEKQDLESDGEITLKEDESKLLNSKTSSKCSDNCKLNEISNLIDRNKIETGDTTSSPLNPFLTYCDGNESKEKVKDNSFEMDMKQSKNNENFNGIMETSEKSKYDMSNEIHKKDSSYQTPEVSILEDEENPSAFASCRDLKSTKFLPPPNEFGGGNPFLIFLCLTLLLQHRNIIMRNNLDYNEMAMHFDKMVRKHDVNRVLNQARRMYFEYLKAHDALATTSIPADNLKLNNNFEKKL